MHRALRSRGFAVLRRLCKQPNSENLRQTRDHGHKNTHNGTTTSITNYEVLSWFESKTGVCTVYGSGRWFPDVGRFSNIHKLIRKKITNVIMCRRSLQSVSPAVTACTKPAVIAAERMMLQPFASHAAGTVSHTSADSITSASIRPPSNLHSRTHLNQPHCQSLS